MLLLSRKKGEVIQIGKNVSIEIIDFGRGVVQVGVTAPKNIPVHRKEVFDAIVEQNKQASATTATISDIKKALSSVAKLTNPKE
ncbi:MAG: carbon storage regulator CsrA [Ignavibacteria bacterium]|jgi:carbon storage regulator|nr:carbon storage regulator CsrA [Ignavibacteria bacterium]